MSVGPNQPSTRVCAVCLGLCFGIIPPLFGQSSNPNWHAGEGHRFHELVVPKAGKAGLALLPDEQTGIFFTNHLSDLLVAQNRVLENGSGVALGDVDGDGWCDIYFCRLEGPNALFRNVRNWRFEEVTKSAGVECSGQYSTGAVLADVDGDGDLDLLVNSLGGGTRCFLNDGRGRFVEVLGSRLVRRFGSMSMALADIDGDGDLDLYVTNYRTDTHKDSPPGLKVEARMVGGRVEVTPADRFFALAARGSMAEVIEKGERDFLYLNDGQGRFSPVSWIAGSFLDEEGKSLAAPPADWGLTVMFRDINEDGLPDIYVCNDFFFSPDRVWINEGGRRFRAIASTALRNMSASSMAVDFADIDRDGDDDFFVVEMLNRDHSARQLHRENIVKKDWNLPLHDLNYRPEVPRNTLCLNRGDGTYAEIAQHGCLDATDWSWAAAFVDVDLDGYEDLLVATGNNHDVQDTDLVREFSRAPEPRTPEVRLKNLRKFPRLEAAKLAFRNRGDLTFEEVSRHWGFDTVSVSHGMALGDLDNDGDLDVVLNNLNSPAAVYRNDGGAPRVAVRLNGLRPNTKGIGAKILLFGGPVPVQSQEVISGGRYLSCDEALRVFAAGNPTNEMKIEVRWRNGRRSVVNGVKADRVYEIEEGSAPPALATKSSPRSPQPVFEDVSSLLQHRHHDDLFDDFERQRLLPRRFSQLGPGVSWCDLDDDGWEDLTIGTGRGGALATFRNDRRGGFVRDVVPGLAQPSGRDVATVIGWHRKGRSVLLVGLSNYEDGLPSGSAVLEYTAGATNLSELLAADASSIGPMAICDIDSDGDLDLFVGGRVLPGRYPVPATSRLYRTEGEALRPDELTNPLLESLGLVSGAVFSDLDGDGDAELVLACEWDSVRVFRNDAGRFREVTRELGLDQYTGWWNGVTAGDFNGDGRLDIAASNWGSNTRYRCAMDQPLRIYYGDFDGNGHGDAIEAYFEKTLGKVVPWQALDEISVALPFVREKFATCRAFGTASVEEILGERFKDARELKANFLQSAIFLNRGDRFEMRALPFEAQVAPAFGICAGDLDGDGNEDLFLSQNFFVVEPQTSRYDAGRAVWLRGDGRGGFTAVSGQESGIKVYGEQRGCALCDYDGDGRVDIAVTQNREETKLYRNVGTRPGLRVRLRGTQANPRAVGAVLRMSAAGEFGPAREIHAGSGYWSQDGTIHVLSLPRSPSQIRVRWPGGKTSLFDVPAGSREIELSMDDKARVVR